MQVAGEIPVGLRILLPLLAALAFIGGPRAADLEAEFKAATAAHGQASFASEAEHLMRLAAWEAWRSPLWERIGQQAYLGHNLELAGRALEKAAGLGALQDSSMQMLGEVYWARGKLELAISTWDGLMKSGRAPAGIYQRVVALRREADRFEEALALAGVWARAYPADRAAAANWALLAAAVGSPDVTMALSRAAVVEPSLTRAINKLFSTLNRAPADAPPAYQNLEVGRFLGEVGEWEFALAAFTRARQQRPDYAEAWVFSAEARHQLHQDGWPDLQKALDIAPNSAVIEAMAGMFLRRAGRFDEAVTYTLRAVDLEPANGLWRIEVGNLLADQHNIQGGLRQYQRATEVEPQNPEIWQLLARYCLEHDLELRATGLPAARQAVVLSSASAESLDVLGAVMLGLGDFSSAERFLQLAVEKDPGFVEAIFHLGQLYLLQGNQEQARYFLAAAARVNSSDSDASLLAARLLTRYFGGQ